MAHAGLLRLLLAFFIVVTATARADSCPGGPPSTDTTSGGFAYTYPWPIRYQQLDYQRQTLCQAYMDVRPDRGRRSYAGPERTVVMLHGKNFCSVTWEATARVLLARGYRVVMPDHIGFCKSSKPDDYQYSLQQLALNTLEILNGLGLTAYNSSTPAAPPTARAPVYVMGHSLGGMLAARFALMFPAVVSRLVMVNPIGLEDWKAKGVPYLPVDDIYRQERASTYGSIRGYEQATYYLGSWTPAYDVWVNMLLQLYTGPLAGPYAYLQALVTDMVLTQPVVYEFPLLAKIPKTLLINGVRDNTAVGKQWSPPAVQAVVGNYGALGKQTSEAIGRNCTLIEFDDLGHAPFIQAPDRFYEALVDWLST